MEKKASTKQTVVTTTTETKTTTLRQRKKKSSGSSSSAAGAKNANPAEVHQSGTCCQWCMYCLTTTFFLILVFACLLVYRFHIGGANRTISPIDDDFVSCSRVFGAPGAEDFDIDTQTGHVFISSANHRNLQPQPGGGGLYSFPLSVSPLHSRADKVQRADDQPPVFHPHGISFFARQDEKYLHVVNHPEPQHKRDTVEVFQLTANPARNEQHEARVKLIKTIHDPNTFISLNGIFSVSVDEFYVTNDHDTKHGLVQLLRDIVSVAGGSVVHCLQDTCTTVGSGIPYANGVTVLDHMLYVAGLPGLYVYSINDNYALQHIIPMETTLDNIKVDQHQRLWIAAHLDQWKFVNHALDPNKISPSHVLTVTPPKHDNADKKGTRDTDYKGYTIHQVYVDEGHSLSASASACRWGRYAIVTPVFDKHFLVCEMNQWI